MIRNCEMSRVKNQVQLDWLCREKNSKLCLPEGTNKFSNDSKITLLLKSQIFYEFVDGAE